MHILYFFMYIIRKVVYLFEKFCHFVKKALFYFKINNLASDKTLTKLFHFVKKLCFRL